MASADDYALALLQLLPPGALWRSLGRQGTQFRALLAAHADELARVDQRGRDLLDEADPRTTEELIEQWEAQVGLPDPCVTTPQTLDERRAAVVARLVTPLGLNEAFFIELAAAAGYTITIQSRPVRLYGRAVYGGPYGDTDWRYVWVVVVDGSGPSEPLECLFERAKPAHTVVQFEYTG